MFFYMFICTFKFKEVCLLNLGENGSKLFDALHSVLMRVDEFCKHLARAFSVLMVLNFLKFPPTLASWLYEVASCIISFKIKSQKIILPEYY